MKSQSRDLMLRGAAQLSQAGLEPARVEAEWLLAHLLGVTPPELYLQEAAVAPETAERFFGWIARRARGTPLQYLTGQAEFFGRVFAVEPGVFIPRPETEAVIEQALPALRARQAQAVRPLRLLDLGTGSGCIAVTLASALPSCLVVGVEVSWNALSVARRNVRRHGLEGRIQLVQGQWLEPIRGRIDAIVANPPYVPAARVNRLPLDVRQEPRMSLDGGTDGLRELDFLLRTAPRALQPGGILAMECGEEQVKPLQRRAYALGWTTATTVLHDLAGRPRGILAVAGGRVEQTPL